MWMSRKFNRSRSCQGQALAEGAAALIMLTALGVGLTLLMLGVGMAMYYKLKVSYAAMSGVLAAEDSMYWNGMRRPPNQSANVSDIVKTAVNSSLKAMGLPESDVIVVTEGTASSPTTVTVTVNGLKIMSGGILPGNVSIKDTAALQHAQNTPPAIFGITVPLPNGGFQGVYVPSYGAGCSYNNLPASPGWEKMVPPSIDGNLGYNQFHINPGAGNWEMQSPRKGWGGGPAFTGY